MLHQMKIWGELSQNLQDIVAVNVEKIERKEERKVNTQRRKRCVNLGKSHALHANHENQDVHVHNLVNN